MARDLNTLIELIARDVSPVMAQCVPSRALVAATVRQLIDEPHQVATAVVGHAVYQEVAEAVAQDADLVRVVTVGATGPMLVAVTGAPRVSPGGLVAEAVGSAAAELRCRGTAPSAEALTATALRNVERMRLIGRRSPTEVVTFLGFSGVSLADGKELELPWGNLSAPVGFYGIAEYVPSVRPTTCVLVAEHGLAIEIDESGSGIGLNVPKPMVDHHDWTQMTMRLVSLAVALGTPRARVAPVPTFQHTVLPYETPISGYHQLVLAPPPVERQLDDEECAEIERCARILAQLYSPRLDVASRRITAGLSQRLDPADRLIDAVTTWESLFSAQVEASFRVTGAIAALLQPDDAKKRDELQRDLVKIYNLRSDVVHGRSANQELVYTRSFEATEFAIQALAAMLERRPELIALEPGERSRRLLLGLA